MKMPAETWQALAQHFKNQLIRKYDPTTIVSESALRDKLDIAHKGFYISIYDSSKIKLLRTGFLHDGLKNILDSCYKVIEAAYVELQAAGIQHKRLLTGQFCFAAIWDVVHINNGLAWDENEDGVYFSWGDTYKGLYLPYEIQQMTVTKVEIMNRLCSWSAQVPSNLWRLPEGMIWRLVCDSYIL